ncbi:hypothetical protein A4D02_25310 [Niastella koreensis]|uniref:Uncharacterized protein n=2 Tax=Niastella koreensis TaxID=354356 RepID=G8TPV5_NIAKG|nr:hypothetical protein Niako_3651 [Niastella koreensis GR20-10]OQP51446.1 hypothetical protein A4D02_25310 [Niastella koreensis]
MKIGGCANRHVATSNYFHLPRYGVLAYSLIRRLEDTAVFVPCVYEQPNHYYPRSRNAAIV